MRQVYHHQTVLINQWREVAGGTRTESKVGKKAALIQKGEGFASARGRGY